MAAVNKYGGTGTAGNLNAFNYGEGPLYRPFGTWSQTGGTSAMIGTNEFRGTNIFRSVLAEFFTTMALTYITCGAIVWGAASYGMPFVFLGRHASPLTGSIAVYTIGYLGIAFAFGCAYLLTVFVTQHISGGYQNPAVTLAMVMVGRLSLIRGFLYALAQMAGAISGAGLVKGSHFSIFNAALGGANIHNRPFSSGGTLLVETVATAILVFVILASIDVGYHPFVYGRHIPRLSPVAVGLAYFALNLAVVPVDGGGMNPARAFGIACIINAGQVWKDQWIFWVGPVVGAIIGGAIYEGIFRRSYIHNYLQNEVAPDGHLGAPGTGMVGPAGTGMGGPVGTGMGGPAGMGAGPANV